MVKELGVVQSSNLHVGGIALDYLVSSETEPVRQLLPKEAYKRTELTTLDHSKMAS